MRRSLGFSFLLFYTSLFASSPFHLFYPSFALYLFIASVIVAQEYEVKEIEMESFSFYNPTRIDFGVGSIRKLGMDMQKAGIKKCLMIAGGGSIKKNGVYTQVCETLEKAEIFKVEG